MLHNLEVLPKDITPDALIKLMKDWNASLNVDCVFCHKGHIGKPWSTYDFTDTSKKRHEVARLMVKSTVGLNEAFKDLGEADEPVKVTCASCHRRSRHPRRHRQRRRRNRKSQRRRRNRRSRGARRAPRRGPANAKSAEPTG